MINHGSAMEDVTINMTIAVIMNYLVCNLVGYEEPQSYLMVDNGIIYFAFAGAGVLGCVVVVVY